MGNVIALPTILATHLAGGIRGSFVILPFAGSPVAVAACWLPWDRWHRRWLLAWPVFTMIGLAGAGSALVGGAAPLAGLFAVAFVLVGLTQPRWTSLTLLPLALPCWVATNGGWTSQLWQRLPVMIGIWVLVAETLAALQQQVRALTAALEEKASTDPLTGLSNRRDLPHLVDLLQPGDAVALLDMDHFKHVNDQFGHAAGDKVLADLGTAIRGMLRSQDCAVRYGGEEVLLILPGAGRPGAEHAIQRLRAEWDQLQPGVSFSAGIALVDEQHRASSAISAADVALYHAKAAGRARSHFAGDPPQDPVERPANASPGRQPDGSSLDGASQPARPAAGSGARTEPGWEPRVVASGSPNETVLHQ